MKTNNKSPKHSTTIDSMSLYELCRWVALKEAVDLVGDKCDERGIDFETFDVKPLDLLKYVDSTTDDLYNRATETLSYE